MSLHAGTGNSAGRERRLPVRVMDALLLLVLVGALLSLARFALEDDDSTVGVVYDWAEDYESLEELLTIPNSIAVEGTVTSVHETFPESVVTIDQVLVGRDVSAGEELVVLQFGARSGALAHEPRDARHLDLGERVLLVLVYEEMHNRYRVAGGPHGHFTIDGTRIAHANFGSREYGLSSDHPEGQPLAELADSLTLDEFKARVVGAATD